MWKEWIKQQEATGNIMDTIVGFMPHTTINSHDHIRIPVEVDIDFRNTSARINELEGTVRTMKTPEQEVSDKEVSNFGISLNMFGKAGVDIAQVASASVINANGVLNSGNHSTRSGSIARGRS